MNEFYRVPALALLSMLLVAFALLYLRARTPRRLLWLAGWSLTVLHLATEVAGHRNTTLSLVISNSTLLLSPLMFLGSMSPLAFRRWPRFLYAYAFAIPLLAFSILVSFYPQPNAVVRVLLILCAVSLAYVSVVWSRGKHILPEWFTLLFSIVMGAAGVWLTYQGNYYFAEYLVESSSNFVTALLFAVYYRRWSPGVLFTAGGFFLWSTPLIFDALVTEPGPPILIYGRAINLIKVMTAVGMILIVLEDELAQNQAAKERDHRARMEMERYSEIDLSLLAGVHTDAAYQHACEVIAEVSRFRQVLLFVSNVAGNFRIAGHAGMDSHLLSGLDALGKRMTREQVKSFSRSSSIIVELGNTLLVDLRPLFVPGDILEQLQYQRAHAIPLATQTGEIEGALILSGLKQCTDPLRADDLLPLELLAARLTALREHDALMQRVAQSEKLAGLGQLTRGVAHELNNPLTVVLGYSQLAEEALDGHPAREMVTQMRKASQRMRLVLESMLRFWKTSPAAQGLVSVPEILRDLCHLQQPELDRRRVELALSMPEAVPPVEGNRTQLQQMFLQIMNHSLESLDGAAPECQRMLRVDVSQQRSGVKVLIADNGPGFADPGRAFDPFSTLNPAHPGSGLDLSVCYAVVRDHGGEIAAYNLEPHGSALVVELPFSHKQPAFAQKEEEA